MQGCALGRPCLQLRVKSLHEFSRRRLLSTTTARLRTPHTEHVEVPCASSGHVVVSLHDVKRHAASAPLIINLPACPVRDVADVDSYLPRFLRRYPSATIHYRWPGAENLLGTLGILKTATLPTPPPSPSTSASPDGDKPHQQRPLRWPTPIHDTLAGYDHLQRTLGTPPPPPPAPPTTSTTLYPGGAEDLPPPPPPPRDVYVYGSYLGAHLAAALALTESHDYNPAALRHHHHHHHEEAQGDAEHAAMTVRGLLALNGLYNWTTLLPDHPIHQRRAELSAAGVLRLAEWEAEDAAALRRRAARLFARPADLFDPFASPVLFFHTPGLMIPPAFGDRWRPDYTLWPSDAYSPSSSAASDVYIYSLYPDEPPPPPPYPDDEEFGEYAEKSYTDPKFAPPDPMAPPPRSGYIRFPPRDSGLRIPETLLLHGTLPQSTRRRIDAAASGAGSGHGAAALRRKLRNAEDSFGSQAAGLAGLMRRSVDSAGEDSEGWGRRWDGGYGEEEALRRVMTEDVGRVDGRDGLGVGQRAEGVAKQWLEDRLG